MVCATGITAQSIPALMDKEGIDFEPIETINWQEYPYRPKVYFRMAYSNDALLVHYKVTEKNLKNIRKGIYDNIKEGIEMFNTHEGTSIIFDFSDIFKESKEYDNL